MGEIDRVNPIVRPVFGPRPADRVQPESDRHHHNNEQPHDKLELTNQEEELEKEAEADTSPVIEEPEHGLDLSI